VCCWDAAGVLLGCCWCAAGELLVSCWCGGRYETLVQGRDRRKRLVEWTAGPGQVPEVGTVGSRAGAGCRGRYSEGWYTGQQGRGRWQEVDRQDSRAGAVRWLGVGTPDDRAGAGCRGLVYRKAEPGGMAEAGTGGQQGRGRWQEVGYPDSRAGAGCRGWYSGQQARGR